MLTIETQERGALVDLLNQQTVALYGRVGEEIRQVEELIKTQRERLKNSVATREFAVREAATQLDLGEDALPSAVVRAFPEFIHPLFEALLADIDRLSDRIAERTRQNSDLKQRLLRTSIH